MDALVSSELHVFKPGLRRQSDAKTTERNIYEWAEMMILMGGRSCVVAKLTKLSDAEVRSMYQRLLGRPSPSGQQPTDIKWYLRSPLLRLHSGLLVTIYSQCAASLPPHAAFANAFYHYARATAATCDRQAWDDDPAFRTSEKDYVIPFSRGYFLTSYYTDALDRHGSRLCELQMRRCKRCQAIFMTHISEASCLCPNCE